MIFKYKEFLLEKQRTGGRKIEDFTDLYVDRVSKKLGYKVIKKLSSGSFGIAYLLNNDKVLKFTTDRNEYANSKSLVGKELEHFPTYYYAKELKMDNQLKSDKLTNVYIIVMDYIPRVDPKEMECFNDGGLEFFHDYLTMYGDIPSDDEISDDMIEFPGNICYNLLKKYIPQIKTFRQEAQDNNIDFLEFHEDNMGVKNGKLIYYDIGLVPRHKYVDDSVSFENDFEKLRKLIDSKNIKYIPLKPLIEDFSKLLNVNKVKSYKFIRDEVYNNKNYSFMIVEPPIDPNKDWKVGDKEGYIDTLDDLSELSNWEFDKYEGNFNIFLYIEGDSNEDIYL